MSTKPLYLLMLLKVFESLEMRGFQEVLTMAPDVHLQDFSFSGTRPVWEEYLGAYVSLHLKYSSHKKLWEVSHFEVTSVYIVGSDDIEKEARLRSKHVRLLEGKLFLAYMGKELAGRNSDNAAWTISCARDLVAMLEAYDKAAQFLGCVPVFLV